MQTSLHTTAIANSSRPEPVYMRMQIILTIYVFMCFIRKLITYYYIRHRASGTRSVSGPPLLFLSSSQIWSCQFFCFKDSAGPGCNSLRDPFSDNFALFFRNTFFTKICTKKAPRGFPKTHQNRKKSRL